MKRAADLLPEVYAQDRRLSKLKRIRDNMTSHQVLSKANTVYKKKPDNFLNPAKRFNFGPPAHLLDVPSRYLGWNQVLNKVPSLEALTNVFLQPAPYKPELTPPDINLPSQHFYSRDGHIPLTTSSRLSQQQPTTSSRFFRQEVSGGDSPLALRQSIGHTTSQQGSIRRLSVGTAGKESSELCMPSQISHIS